MEILLLLLSKYIFGYLLQDIIFVMGIYTFGKQKIEKRTFSLMLLIFIPTNIIVRSLPMSYGIHILINIAVLLYVSYKFCDFDLYAIIRSTLTITILVLITEMLCFGSLLIMFGKSSADAILQNQVLKASVYVPFNILLGLIVYLCYKKMISKNY